MAKSDVIPGSISEAEDMETDDEDFYLIYLPLVRSVVGRILPQHSACWQSRESPPGISDPFR